MTKNEVCQAVARRLGCSAARIPKLLDSLHKAGLIQPTKGSRRFPPEIDEHDTVAIVLAVLSDRGLDPAADNTRKLAALHGAEGRFDNWLQMVLFGPPRHVQHIVVGPDGVSVVVDGVHVVFGQAPQTAAKIVPGTAVMALAAELQGASPRDADAIAALTNIRRAYAQH